MKIIVTATKSYVQLLSNGALFYYGQFSVVKIVEEYSAEGVYYCGLIEKNHKGFFLYTLVKLTKLWPVWSYFVMKSTPIVIGDIPLMAIGYKYISWKVPRFIDTQGSGSTYPVYPYLLNFPDNYSNVHI